ncbi:MAG: sulfate ABC transporter substrate-binding protein [Anaerolineae bacterium]
MFRWLSGIILVTILAAGLAGCASGGAGTAAPAASGGSAPAAPTAAAGGSAATAPPSQASSGATKLILGAYTTPREAYGEIIPLFKKYWKTKTGQDVEFQESYQASGAQSRAIVEGFEADVAALSLEDDITRLQTAGLITHDWKNNKYNGIPTTSIAVIMVRKGNPKGIKDWKDLTAPGLNVLTPNPKTSGGAMWNILGLYGAAVRGQVDGVAKGDETAATNLLKSVLKNVSVMDKSGRDSVVTYEKGVGDVAISYENEAQVGRMNGQDYEYVIPRSTIKIENPVAVVDKYVDKHGTRQVAEAFADFLYTKEAQEVFAKYGLRVVDPDVAKSTASKYPPVQDLFTINDLGGWKTVTPKIFGDTGLYSKAIEEVQAQK